MNRKLKICLVTDRLPFPPDTGRKATLYSFCRRLHEDWGHEICVMSFTEAGSDPGNKPPFIKRLVVLPRPSNAERLYNVFIRSLLKREMSLQSALYRGMRAARTISGAIDEEVPDAVVFSMSRTGHYHDCVRGAKKIFDMDDCLSIRYRRMLKQGLTENAMGRLGKGIIGRLAGGRLVGRLMLTIEAALLQREEARLVEMTDATVVVNPVEAERLAGRLKTEKIHAISNRVDTDFFKPAPGAREETALVFHGLMSMPHNRQAVGDFLKDVFPVISNKVKTKLYVIGADVPDYLLSLSSENVHFTGRVQDVREWLSKGAVYVAWIWGGSGMKTKVLEAMSMGLPLVTTSFGVQGVGGKDGRDYFVRDEPHLFAGKVIELLSEPGLRARTGANGRAFIEGHYEERAVVSKWNRLIQDITK